MVVSEANGFTLSNLGLRPFFILYNFFVVRVGVGLISDVGTPIDSNRGAMGVDTPWSLHHMWCV